MDDLIEELKKRLTIEVARFDACYFEVSLKIDDEVISGSLIDVPAQEIRENWD